MTLLRIAAIAALAGSSPVPGTRHRRRAYLPGRQPCGPWQYQPPKPPSKRPIIIEDIIGTAAIIGIDTILAPLLPPLAQMASLAQMAPLAQMAQVLFLVSILLVVS